MRYADDVARLAQAVAALTAAGPPTGILHGAERQAVLVSRDAVATELRDLTRVVLGIAPQQGRLDLELMTVNPPALCTRRWPTCTPSPARAPR